MVDGPQFSFAGSFILVSVFIFYYSIFYDSIFYDSIFVDSSQGLLFFLFGLAV